MPARRGKKGNEMPQLTRYQLYAWAWSETVESIAAELKISKRYARAFCDRHAIPRPTRGYWRQRETGQIPERVALRDASVNTTFEFSIAEPLAQQLDQIWAAFQAGRHAPLVRRGSPGTRPPQVSIPSDAEHHQAASQRQAALGHEPAAAARLAGPAAPGSLRPEAATLAMLASRHAQFLAVRAFLDAVEVSAKDCEPIAAAVVAVWIDAARAANAAHDPTRQVIEHCSRLTQFAVAPVVQDVLGHDAGAPEGETGAELTPGSDRQK